MKLSLLLLSIFCLILTSCNHSPKEEQTAVNSIDSVISLKASSLPDSVILQEPIVKSLKHYFSDTTTMDSFVIEMPAGNIINNYLYVKIYDVQNNLLFIDSSTPTNLWSGEFFNQVTQDPALPVSVLKQNIMGMFTINNFNYAGQEDAIKNATATDVKNMIAWNEAVNDTDRIVFNYYGNGTKNYVNYSYKLKRGVISVQTFTEDED